MRLEMLDNVWEATGLMKARRLTLVDLARETNLSISTLSRALRGDSRVAESTRQRVVAEANRLQYRSPDGQAGRYANFSDQTGNSAIPGIRQVTLLVMRPNLHDFYKETLVELMQLGYEQHFKVNVMIAPEDDLAAQIPRAIDQGANAVFIFTWSHLTDDDADIIENAQIPIILVNRYIEGRTNAVTLDDFGAGLQAARYLLGLGHLRIAHLTGPLGSSTLRERAAGFRIALEIAGCYDAALFSAPAKGDVFEWVRLSVERLLAIDPRPTAIWAHNDVTAGMALVAVRSKELRVPEDISIMGFNRMPELRNSGLTTFDHRFRDFAHHMFLLLKSLCTGEVQGPVRFCVAPRLVIGTTTGPAPVKGCVPG